MDLLKSSYILLVVSLIACKPTGSNEQVSKTSSFRKRVSDQHQWMWSEDGENIKYLMCPIKPNNELRSTPINDLNACKTYRKLQKERGLSTQDIYTFSLADFKKWKHPGLTRDIEQAQTRLLEVKKNKVSYSNDQAELSQLKQEQSKLEQEITRLQKKLEINPAVLNSVMEVLQKPYDVPESVPLTFNNLLSTLVGNGPEMINQGQANMLRRLRNYMIAVDGEEIGFSSHDVRISSNSHEW